MEQRHFLQITLPIFFLVVFWLWENKISFFPKGSNRYPHAAHNLALTLCNAVIITLLFSSAIVWCTSFTLQYEYGLLYLTPLQGIPLLIAGIFIMDGITYLWHRANHVIPFLWRFHKVHHSDNAMDVTTATRFHPIELALSYILRLVVILIIGLNIDHLFIYSLLLLTSTQFHHANISIGKWDAPLRWVIVTPDMHKLHHSRIMGETNSNYTSIFSFWDRIGFSFKMRSDLQNIRFGLDNLDLPEQQKLPGMLKTPFTPETSTNRQPQRN